MPSGGIAGGEAKNLIDANGKAEGYACVIENDSGSRLLTTEGEVKGKINGTTIEAGVDGKIAVFSLHTDKTAMPIDGTFLGGQVGAEVGNNFQEALTGDGMVGAKVEARAILADVDVGPFGLRTGISADTGAEFRNGTLDVEVLGTGFKVGRKIGPSIFGNEFTIDIGKIFDF